MKTTPKTPASNNTPLLRVGIVVPHIFMHKAILPHVIFSPGQLALNLADGLQMLGAKVTLFTPGPVKTTAVNVMADLRLFEQELAGRNDTYISLLKKHPATFVTLARQVQSELIAKAYTMANAGQLDIVHVYTNEEETALPFAALCQKPVVFTHHDPFNFLVKYKNVLPKYAHLNWLSMSLAQRSGMPADTNWVANIYHGIDKTAFTPVVNPTRDYAAYLGRIIEPKGVHIAIAAAKKAGIKLKIAGKHYAGHKKDTYWHNNIEPLIDGKQVEYVGYLRTNAQKQQFLGNARATLVPSTFSEPFGLVTTESLACGTPVIGLKVGATPEIIKQGVTGYVVSPATAEQDIADALANAAGLSPSVCRANFEQRFTLEHMCREHFAAYRKVCG